MPSYDFFHQAQYTRTREQFKTPTFDLTQTWGKVGGEGQTILDAQILPR